MSTALIDLSVLATSTRSSGVGRYVAELGCALERESQGTDIRVRGIETLSWTGRTAIVDDIAGAVERLTSGEGRPQLHAIWAAQRRVTLAPAARGSAADVVHLGDPSATPLGDLGCPRVTTCHDLSSLHAAPDSTAGWRDNYREGLQALDHRRYHSADRVIAVSETTANALVTLLGVPARKIDVVYNGVDSTRWSPEPGERDAAVRASYGLAERNYVLYVGAADRRKNPDGMLQALALARRRDPELDVVLAWAASLPDPVRWRVMTEARAAGVQDSILLLGYVPDTKLSALYRGAAAQLFVSRAEGFGYPVVEAMASGCPVITSNRSAMAEIAHDAAIQCDPEDHEAIADAIVSLAGSSSERSRLSRAGSRRAQRFTCERMARETLETYRTLIRGNG